MSLTFVPMTDKHLAASLEVGESAGKVYKMAKGAEALGFPEAVLGDLRIAHAALNRAACSLMGVAIRDNDPSGAVAHYSAMAVEAGREASGGAA
jgi:hypothetical protein